MKEKNKTKIKLNDNKENAINIVHSGYDEKEDLIRQNKEQEQLIKTLMDKNNEQERSFDVLKNQIAEMQSAFIKMQSNQNMPIKNNKDKKYSIGCRLINGVTLFSPKREVERRITYGQLSDVTEYEMDMLSKNNQVIDFLKKDVIYFGNEEDYDTFKITDRLDISDEKLINVALNCDSNKLINELNRWTREKRDDPVLHSLFYRFVELYTDGKIARMTYENRKAIENYFRFTIDNAQLLLKNLKNIK